MGNDVEALAAELEREADELLEGGLRDLLSTYGRVEPMGSYVLGLMVWRDLDVHVVRDDVDRAAFFELGAKLRELLAPQKMSYRDELAAHTPGLPAGLYWGMYLGDERAGAWEIDVWAVDERQHSAARDRTTELARRLAVPDLRDALRLKGAVWRHPGYRSAFSSQDVYEAVLELGITETEAFGALMRERGITF